MTGTATRVKNLNGWRGEAALYHLSPPLDEHEFVVVSAALVPYSGPETYIFPADDAGEVAGYLGLPGSFRGSLDHESALQGAGYEVSA